MGWQDDPILSAAQPPAASASTPWENDPVVSAAQPQAAQAPQQAGNIFQAAEAGLENSSTGLMVRGKLPDVVLDPSHAPWYQRMAESAGQMAGDLPEMVAGGLAGATAGTAAGGPVGTVVGAGAGAMAVPTAIRTALIHAYQAGHSVSAGDFLNRTTIWQTVKSAAVGGFSALSGLGAARAVGSAVAPVIGETIAPETAAKLITGGQLAGNASAMAVAPALLDGRMPDKQDFIDAAVMTVGLHAAGAAADRMMSIYAKTGVSPLQVAAEAKSDPDLAKELAEPVMEGGDPIPEALQPLAAETTARTVIPDPMVDESHAQSLAAFLRNPYAEIPESKLPNFENFKYIDSPMDADAVSARASELFEKDIQAARGTESWEQTKQQAVSYLANRAAQLGQDFVMPSSDDEIVKLASKGMAVQSLQQAASRMLAAASQKVLDEGPTDENVRAQLNAIEMQRAWLAVDQGNGAEIARALNARKAMAQTRAIAENAVEGYTRYADDPVALAQHIASLRDPNKVTNFVRQLADKPATLPDKLLQYWRFALLSGATVLQVKGAGDTLATLETLANSALRVPISAMRFDEPGARAAELKAMLDNFGQGAKDGMRAMIDTWKASRIPQRAVFGEPGKPNLMDKITNFPHRIIESETQLFRVLNERMELARQASAKATGGGLVPGTQEYDTAYTKFLQNPDKDMEAAAKLAGDNATFTGATSGLGALLKDVSNGKYGWAGSFVVPFAKVPVNLAAWSIKDTPALGMMMKSMRDDWKEGGAKRDAVIARQVIGGSVAYLAAGAVAKGILTGGGLSMSPEQRIARRASGVPDYSVKVGDTWYRYDRFQPLATIAGVTADLMEMHEAADAAYKPDIYKLVAGVLGHTIISMPYFEGLHQFMDSITSPEQGTKTFDSFVASWVPSFLAQTASSADPEMRQVNDVMDAVKERIPGWRETLLPKINPLTGKPEPTTRGLGLVATQPVTDDPVLQEAARLQIGVSNAPKAVELSADGQRDLGQVALTPEQQEIFASTSGQTAYEIMSQMVKNPMWAQMPDLVKTKVFQKALEIGHKEGSLAALPPEQRVQEMDRIINELQKRLGQ